MKARKKISHPILLSELFKQLKFSIGVNIYLYFIYIYIHIKYN